MNRKHKKYTLAIIFAVVFSILISNFAVFAAQCEDVRQNTFRLHIIANSDSEEDQSLKLRIRDRILSETGEIFSKCDNLEKSKELCAQNLQKIKLIAQNEIASGGYSYRVDAEICNMYFETRSYDNVTLPAGRYSALRITIGEGAGQNWWCVLFPPLCISAATESGESEILEPVTDAYPKYKIKFKIVELIERLRLLFWE